MLVACFVMLQCEKLELTVRSGYTFAKRKLARFTEDHRSGRTSQKRPVNRKANCST